MFIYVCHWRVIATQTIISKMPVYYYKFNHTDPDFDQFPSTLLSSVDRCKTRFNNLTVCSINRFVKGLCMRTAPMNYSIAIA